MEKTLPFPLAEIYRSRFARSPMTDFASTSPEELADRRRTLRRQRRLRNLQNIWRVLAVSGIAAGTLWLISHPVWVIRHSDQISIEGNELLSDEAIQALLPLQYPQSLLEIKPDQVVRLIQTQSPITYAEVTRQLFPPRLKVYVQERHPVAVTIPTQPKPLEVLAQDSSPTHQPGLLDSQGNWMAQSSFSDVEPDVHLPELRVKGFDTQYRAHWPILYQALKTAAVDITEVDLRVPNNVILHTQVGPVHLGVFDPQTIQQQLATLAQLRSLTDADNIPEVEYIDLSNPEVPAIKTISLPD
ncbi:MAG: FtsQ-type POTRA domain-containing protein [Cyanobacteria bacterium P01_F01_bin.86]